MFLVSICRATVILQTLLIFQVQQVRLFCPDIRDNTVAGSSLTFCFGVSTPSDCCWGLNLAQQLINILVDQSYFDKNRCLYCNVSPKYGFVWNKSPNNHYFQSYLQILCVFVSQSLNHAVKFAFLSRRKSKTHYFWTRSNSKTHEFSQCLHLFPAEGAHLVQRLLCLLQSTYTVGLGCCCLSLPGSRSP